MSRPRFDDEMDDDFKRQGKKHKSWKDQRHQKSRKKERDFYENDQVNEEQDYRGTFRTHR